MAVFLQIEGVEGNCIATGHEKWLEVESWSWGSNNASNVGRGGGGASLTTASVTEMNLTLVTGKSCVNLMDYVLTGKHIPTIVLETTKTTGGDEGKHISITMKTCQITSFSESGSRDGYNTDTIAIAFEEHEHEVFEQDSAGILASAGKQGFNVKTRVRT